MITVERTDFISVPITDKERSMRFYGDTLGPGGSDGDTYLGMEAADAETIARGVSGGRAPPPR